MNPNQPSPQFIQDQKRIGELIRLFDTKSLTSDQMGVAIEELQQIKARLYQQKNA